MCLHMFESVCELALGSCQGCTVSKADASGLSVCPSVSLCQAGPVPSPLIALSNRQGVGSQLGLPSVSPAP